MKSLLDKFTPVSKAFRPGTATELFALRLAQKLDDAPAVRHYAELADSYSESQLLRAYRRALRAKGIADLGKLFHAELQQGPSNGSNGSTRLIAIRVERRAVAAAIFNGQHLDFTDSRQLSSAHDQALVSAVRFARWILGRFPVESAVLESIPNGRAFQRRVLSDTICELLRDHLLPIWEVPRTTLLEAYGYPALKSRVELRRVATTIWPVLAGTHAKVFIQDAVVLGLHVQTERLFTIH